MTLAELHQLPSSEKLRIIEALWDDLVLEEGNIEVPHWHKEELGKTETRLAAGKEEIVNWQDAKEELQKRFK